MKTIFLLALLFPLTALATTKVKTTGQAVELNCKIRAKFLAPRIIRDRVVKGGITHPYDQVFWKVEVLEASNPAQCPALGSADLHVRGSQVSPVGEPEQISYRIGFTEPRAGTISDLTVAFTNEIDSFSKKKANGWYVVGLGRE